MLAKKKLSVLMLSVAFSSAAWAGLGGIVVRSNLGEPLRAEIELSGTDGEVQRVGLAAMDTFRELKVDYAPLLSSLRFTLAQRANGRPYIRVTSLAPVSEPYLRFVVEAKMPSGRSVREYTVLLDPVDYGMPAAPVPAPAPLPPLVERVAPAATPRLPALPRAERDVPRREQPDGISVRPGQTLHQLAASLALPGVSPRQVMAALLEANPQAFISGNPDQLRAGARLKVPPLSQIRALGRERSNSILAAGRTPVTTAVAPATAAPVAAAPAQPAATAEQLVKLEPVTAPASAPAVDASASVAVSEQVLQLQQAQEKIAELEKRLNALQAARQSAPAPEEHGEPLLDKVMAYLPLIGGALAAVLLGLAAIIMLRRRRHAAAGHGGASTLRKQSLQQAEAEALTAGNTFLTDFTRGGAVGAEASDVDPIAEAEVYLAYGRDQQAEEILKEALAKDPTLHEVRAKLLEIYASRQDRIAFEPHARSLHDALGGQGTLWDKVARLGRGIDPANVLYGGVAAAAADTAGDAAFVASPMDIDLDSELMGNAPAADAAAAVPAVSAVDDDPLRTALLGDEPLVPDEPPKVLAPELDIESLLASAEQVVAEPAPEPAEPEPEENKHMLDFDFQLDEPEGAGSPLETLAAAQPDANTVDFDFGLDSLDTPAPPVSTEGMSVSDDPLSTKLDLARVYLDMGDKDGAREVLEELVAEADGALKQEAANLLASL